MSDAEQTARRVSQPSEAMVRWVVLAPDLSRPKQWNTAGHALGVGGRSVNPLTVPREVDPSKPAC